MLSIVFSDSGQSLGKYVQDVAFADLDSDDDLDAFVGNYGSANTVWINNGHGNLTDSGQVLQEGSRTNRVALGDIDGDGDIDAVVVNSRDPFDSLVPLAEGLNVDEQHDTVWFNDGRGQFSERGQTFGDTRGNYDVWLGDVDGDGDLDCIIIGLDGGLWLNDGQGVFTRGPGGDLVAWARSDIGVGDFDADGDLDAVAIGPFSGALLYMNHDDGSGPAFVFSGGFADVDNSASYQSVETGDIDGDGDLDIVLGVLEILSDAGMELFSSLQTMVWVNDGQGRFTSNEKTHVRAFDAWLDDIDTDGDLDIVSVKTPIRYDAIEDAQTEVTYTAWLNDGQGNFTDALGEPSEVVSIVTVLPGLYDRNRRPSASFADIDRDGDLDIFAGGKIWFTESTAFELAAGDATGDRRFNQQDIVRVLQSAKYLTGKAATFAEGDWNGDGIFDQMDIVAALQTGNYLQGRYALLSL